MSAPISSPFGEVIFCTRHQTKPSHSSFDEISLTLVLLMTSRDQSRIEDDSKARPDPWHLSSSTFSTSSVPVRRSSGGKEHKLPRHLAVAGMKHSPTTSKLVSITMPSAPSDQKALLIASGKSERGSQRRPFKSSSTGPMA